MASREVEADARVARFREATSRIKELRAAGYSVQVTQQQLDVRGSA
jgi:hypothetical protein